MVREYRLGWPESLSISVSIGSKNDVPSCMAWTVPVGTMRVLAVGSVGAVLQAGVLVALVMIYFRSVVETDCSQLTQRVGQLVADLTKTLDQWTE